VNDMKREFVVREARASDKDLVLRFCQNTFEWGDYIENVWDYWLTDSSGKLFVATFEDIPVGVSHVAVVKRGEAWVEGARVASEFRRMGVASLLNDASFKWTSEHDAKVVRAVTDSTNVVAQKALTKLGFRFVSEWVMMEFDGCQLEASEHTRFAEKADLPTLWSFLQGSEGFKKSGGLFAVVFRWKSLDKSDLQDFVERHMAVICERDEAVRGLILFDDTVKRAWQENSFQTCYVDGDFESVLSMGRFLKGFFYEEGVARIYGATHNHAPICSAFSELGFKSGGHTELVYARKLSHM
jgi:ribosomal protein S18 acetylase RimI-like enzyme